MFEDPDVYNIKKKLRDHQYKIEELKPEEYENDLITLLDKIGDLVDNPNDYCTCDDCEAKYCTNKY